VPRFFPNGGYPGVNGDTRPRADYALNAWSRTRTLRVDSQ
jgi:hypothetical protein